MQARHRLCLSPPLSLTARHPTLSLTASSSRWSSSQFGQMTRSVPPWQEDLVPLPTAPLAFPLGAGGGPAGVRHLPSTLQPFCVRQPNPWLRHDVLRQWIHATGFCTQHRGGRGEGQPTMHHIGEVGRWQATGHCSPEQWPVVCH